MLSRRPSPLRTPSSLRASPPQGHPNTTLLGFRVCPQTPGRLKITLLSWHAEPLPKRSEATTPTGGRRCGRAHDRREDPSKVRACARRSTMQASSAFCLHSQVAAVLDRIAASLEALEAVLAVEMSPLWAPLRPALRTILGRVRAMQRYLDLLRRRLDLGVERWLRLMLDRSYPLPALAADPPDPAAEDD